MLQNNDKHPFFNFTNISPKTSLDHIESTQEYIITSKPQRSESMSLCLVIYANKHYYSTTPIKNQQKHLPGVNNNYFYKLISLFLIEHFTNTYKTEPTNIFIGHEHSLNKNHCFYQVIIFFNHKFSKIVQHKEFSFINQTINEINNFRFLLIRLKAISPFSANQYIKRSQNLFAYDISNLNQTELTNTNCHYKETNTHSMSVVNPNLSCLELSFEVSSPNWIINNFLLTKYPLIKKWYEYFVIPTHLRIRKALLLYSPNKKNEDISITEFLPKVSYIIIENNSLLLKTMKNENPCLLVLKIVNCTEIKKNITSLKELIRGRTATIVSKDNTTLVWKHRIPCIIFTVNKYVVKYFYEDKELKDLIFFQELQSDSDGVNESVMEKRIEIDFSSELIKDIQNKSSFNQISLNDIKNLCEKTYINNNDVFCKKEINETYNEIQLLTKKRNKSVINEIKRKQCDSLFNESSIINNIT